MKAACFLLLFFATITFCSCHEGNISDKKQVIQDSLAKVFPTWQAVQIVIDGNNTSIQVVIGDATFYKAPDDIKKAKAEQLGKMILRICEKNNYLESGILIATADIHNTSEAPADGIKIPIDFKGLKSQAQ